MVNAARDGTLSLGALGSDFADPRLSRAEVEKMAPASDDPDNETLIPATALEISVGATNKERFRALITEKTVEM